jgi:CheY-like chemotaxis protein
MTILVVDDEPDLCEMLAFEFELHGSKVFAANSGLGALGIVNAQPVDAVITDIRMNGCDGIELLEKLRRRNSQVPAVIFITAYESDIAAFEAYSKGAEGFFAKPFSLTALVSSVQKVLAPPAERWALPPAAPPERRLERSYSDIETAQEEKALRLGRGGMALAIAPWQASPGENLGFNIAFARGAVPRIEGVGIVRWVQYQGSDTAVCGIEFEYLTEPSRDAVVRWQESHPCRPFIPQL